MARIGVGGVLLRRNQILLGKRSADRSLYPGVWDTVGGHWIEGETHEQTLIRELGEELGVFPLEYRLLAIVGDPRPDLNGDGQYHVYLITKWRGTPRNLRKDEHSELAWVSLDEVDKLDLVSPDLVTLFRSIRESAKEG